MIITERTHQLQHNHIHNHIHIHIQNGGFSQRSFKAAAIVELKSDD